jgi:hypothetical protein
LKKRREGCAGKKVKPGGLDVPPQIFKKAQKWVWIGVVIVRCGKPGKIKKIPRFEKNTHTNSGGNAAKKATDKTDDQHRNAQSRAVKKQLRVKED